MNKDLHDIDDLFKNSIDGHAEEVPPDVWNNIDHSLDKKQAAFYKRKYFTVRAAAILLVLIGGATIAAILRFHNPERRSRLNSENAVTVSGVNKAGKARKNKIEEDSFNKPVEGKTNSIAKNIPLDNKETNGFDTTGSTNKTAIAKKESSKKYSSMNSRTYSAQKNEGLTTISHSNKTQKQKVPVKYKPVLETSVDFVTSQSNNKVEEKKNIERSGKIIDTPKETKIISRTTLFEAKPLKENPAGLVATLSLTHLKSSINFAVSSSVAQKSRPGISLHSWSISPMYAQNINLNTLKDDDHFRDPRNNRLEAKRTEQRSTGFTAGLGIQKEIGENVVLQTGIQLKGRKADDANELTWNSSNEKNITEYIVERKLSNENRFNPIGIVKANETKFYDNRPLDGMNLYRLKVVYNNKIEYSNTVSIASQTNAITVYPNPVLHQWNVVISNNKPMNYKMELIDISGKLVFSFETKAAANSTFNFSRKEEWKPGMYLLRIINQSSGAVEIRKLVLQ